MTVNLGVSEFSSFSKTFITITVNTIGQESLRILGVDGMTTASFQTLGTSSGTD